MLFNIPHLSLLFTSCHWILMSVGFGALHILCQKTFNAKIFSMSFFASLLESVSLRVANLSFKKHEVR